MATAVDSRQRYKLRRKCGKAVCRCQEGHLHESWVLSVPEKGRKRLRTVPLDLVVCRSPQDQALTECWGILSTAGDEQHAAPALGRYRLRVGVEERHRIVLATDASP